jgi:high affinity sulfate transporter 1
VSKSRLGPEILAGVTLAALAIPEALGYARIAGMPVVTGLYTMLVPLAVFVLLGSSRHLVIGADSATAAILAAGLTGVAAVGSPRYVQLAGTAALVVGVMLVLARLIRLGFLANFLSRTVLVGFLTGVGILVASGQLAEMLGLPDTGGGTVVRLVGTVRALGQADGATVLVSVAVILVTAGTRYVTRRVPGALIAVVGAIVAGWLLHLPEHGVHVLGPVPGGLPDLTLPSFAWRDVSVLLPIAVSMFVVILAQSTATSRAYASKYDEVVDEDADLAALGGANLAAAFTGAFVVNGSPTKTQIADSAGGRSQLTSLVTAAVVALVLVFVAGPLAYLPLAALAAVVFVIGVELIDVAGMRRIHSQRRGEFVVALLTAAAVVFLGVEQGIVLAIVVSIIDHLRHSYEPRSSVLAKSAAGHWRSLPVSPGLRTVDGLVVYRFGSSLYFANASKLAEDVTDLTRLGTPLTWLCLDAAAIGDVDYTAAVVLTRVRQQLESRGIRLVLSNLIVPVRRQLDRYGITAAIGAEACFDTAGEALEAFHASRDAG